MKNYVGKVVFVERVDPTKSSYGLGEFIIVEQSPNNLYGVQPVAGYGGHEQRQLPLAGPDRVAVIREDDEPEFLKRFAKELRHFAETPKRGEKTQWVASLYDQALRNAVLIEKLAGCACEPKQTQSFVAGGNKITITIEPV